HQKVGLSFGHIHTELSFIRETSHAAKARARVLCIINGGQCRYPDGLVGVEPRTLRDKRMV
ncbi:MAG: hypothetical protein ABIU05_18685, partial [Nitrospirales bacterium]